VKLYLLCSGIIAHIEQFFVDGIKSAVNIIFNFVSLTTDRKRPAVIEMSALTANIGQNNISLHFSTFAVLIGGLHFPKI
jgi:hypothetical protein